MRDRDKSKEQLLGEVAQIRQQLAALEAECQEKQEALSSSETILATIVKSVPDYCLQSGCKGYYTVHK